MALNSAGITAAIAALSISGLNIKDIDDNLQSITVRDCPALFPKPESWFGGSRYTSEDETTFGTPSTRYWIAHTTLTYAYIHSPIGSGRSIQEKYPLAVTDIEAIATAILQLDISGVDVEDVTPSAIGSLQDAAGNKYIGCNFTMTFRERINA